MDLALVTDPAQLPQQVAVTLGVPEAAGRSLLESLAAHLRGRQALLVLDNCEHVLPACAALAEAVLRACPRVSLLATSRESLGIGGEAVLPVPPLSVPGAGQPLSVADLNAYSAVRLFLDRARLAQPGFGLAPESAPALARICQRLEGLPLAIELVAARVTVLTIEQLADGLDDAFRLLTGGSRTAQPRQQTLRAAIDWSYRLLTAAERELFSALCEFCDGCTLAAAEAICGGPHMPDVLPGLVSLVAKSMVLVDQGHGPETRYSLRELMRQYAREKVDEAGGHERLAARHRDYYLAIVETIAPRLHTAERMQWTHKLEAEREIIRQALEWSFRGQPDLEAGLRLAAAMNGAWPTQHENLAWLKRAITLCEASLQAPAGPYAAILGMAARWAAPHQPRTARDWAQRAVALSRGLGPNGQKTLMDNLFDLGWIGLMGLVHLDDLDDALAPFAEVETLSQALGPDKFPVERFLFTAASLALLRANADRRQAQPAEARAQAAESSRLYEKARNPWGSYAAQMLLGSAELALNEIGPARQCFQEALRLCDEIGLPVRKAYVRRWLAQAELCGGQLENAQRYCLTSLEQAARLGDPYILASCLGLLAGIRAAQGQPIPAAGASGAARALYAKLGQAPWEETALAALLPGWADRPEQAAIWQAYQIGQAMSVEQAAAAALSDWWAQP